MSKSILVIDTPSDCNHCQFADISNGQWECKQRQGKRIAESMKKSSTPSWCPLKPMPEKRESKNIHPFYECYADGWNDCLDYITGDEE